MVTVPPSSPPIPTPNIPVAPSPNLSTEPPKPESTGIKLPWTVLITILVTLLLGAAFIPIYIILIKPLVGNSIVIKDQPSSTSIRVEKLALTRPGYLVFYLKGRTPPGGAAIAATAYITPDTYTDFEVELVFPTQYPLMPGDTIEAIIFQDTDGDRFLDHDKDTPTKDLFGNKIQVVFKVL